MSYTVRFVVVDPDPYEPDIEGAKCTLDGVVKYTVGSLVDFFNVSAGDHSYSVEKEGMQFVGGEAPFLIDHSLPTLPIQQSGTISIPSIWPTTSLFPVMFDFVKISAGEFRFDSWNPPTDTREVFIVGAAWPAVVRKVDVGEDVYAYYVIKNVGTVVGKPTLTVKDLDTDLIIKTWDYPELAPNARFKTGAPGTYIGKMPSRDWRLEFEVTP